MKRSKAAAALLVLVMMVMLVPGHVEAAAAVKLTLDDKVLTTDVAPVIESGTTLVPIKVVAENLGCDVYWDAGEKTVTIVSQEYETIVLTIGSTSVTKGDSAVSISVPAKIISGRTMIPIRFLAENLGLSVGWNSGLRQVCIYTAGYLNENGIDDVPQHVQSLSNVYAAEKDLTPVAVDTSKLVYKGLYTIKYYVEQGYPGQHKEDYGIAIYEYNGIPYIDFDKADSYLVPYDRSYSTQLGSAWSDYEYNGESFTLTRVDYHELVPGRTEYTLHSGYKLIYVDWDADNFEKKDVSANMGKIKAAIDALCDEIYAEYGVRFKGSQFKKVTAELGQGSGVMLEKYLCDNTTASTGSLSNPAIHVADMPKHGNFKEGAMLVPIDFYERLTGQHLRISNTFRVVNMITDKYLAAAGTTLDQAFPKEKSSASTASNSNSSSTATTAFKVGDPVYRLGLWTPYGSVIAVNGSQVQVYWTHLINGIDFTDLTANFTELDSFTRSMIESQNKFKFGASTWIESSELKKSLKTFY